MKIKTIRKIAGMTALTFLILAGCATPYQPYSMMGGYFDKRIDENTFHVFFSGNGYSKREMEYAYFLHRCAEVTKNNGFDYFVIQNYEDFKVLATYDRRGGVQADIKLFKGAAPSATAAAYDGQKVLKEDAPHNKTLRKITLQ